MKAHDIFPGVCIPDIFMRRVEERGEWYLFDPHEVRTVMGYSLEDAWGDEFERRYTECEEAAIDGRLRYNGRTIAAIDVMKRIMTSGFETGTPFIFYRDTVNRANPNKHAGMIYCSNLCTEICQNMSETQLIAVEEDGDYENIRILSGDYVVCNLSSLNLGRVRQKSDIERIVTAEMRMLDNTIDNNYYPIPQAKRTNQRYRAVGLGASGYAQWLAQNKIIWESDAHVAAADSLFEEIAYWAIRTSNVLAIERGAYSEFSGSDWETGAYFADRGYITINDAGEYEAVEGYERWQVLAYSVKNHGMRNGWVMSPAPTASTSLIAGSSACCDPIFARFFVEEKKNAVIPQTAPGLNAETMFFYKEAHTIDQTWSIRAAGARQRHIDQAQSFNVYITPLWTAPQLLAMYVQAWKDGLKTLYYTRNQSLEVEDCEVCSA